MVIVKDPVKKAAFLFVIVVMTISAAVYSALPQQGVAGTVSKIKGSVIAVQNATVRPLKLNDQILIGDILSTGAEAGLEITMIDEGIFTLGSETSFVVIDYTFGQNNDGNAVFDLLKGAVDGVSGQIAKLEQGEGLIVDTKVATIGIRGTKFFIGELEGQTQIAHWSGGGVLVQNPSGSVFLQDDNTGVSLNSVNSAPGTPQPWDDEKKKRAKALVDF